MRTAMFTLALGLGAVSAHAQLVQEMTPDLVKQAIAEGTKAKSVDSYKIGDMIITWGFYTTPYRRVMIAANEAKRKYKTFTEADATPEMIAPELHVYAPANVYKRDVRDVEAIVVMKRGTKDAVQPIASEAVDEEYSNAFGATVKGRGMRARFPLAVVTAQNDIKIVFGGGLGEKGDKFDVGKIR